MIALDRPPTTLQALVDDLLLREHVAELTVAPPSDAEDHARVAGPGSAS